MGVSYELINETKQELVSFIHLTGSKWNELLMNHPQSAITTLYLLKNQGDQIRFISDQEVWSDEIKNYKDVTQDYVDELIATDIFRQEGYEYQDEDNPDDIYVLKLTKVKT